MELVHDKIYQVAEYLINNKESLREYRKVSNHIQSQLFDDEITTGGYAIYLDYVISLIEDLSLNLNPDEINEIVNDPRIIKIINSA